MPNNVATKDGETWTQEPGMLAGCASKQLHKLAATYIMMILPVVKSLKYRGFDV